MSNRSFGYLIIGFLILFLLIPTTYMVFKTTGPKHTRTIIFDNVSSMNFINPQDPVKVKGYEVGIVRSVTSNGNQSTILIECQKPLIIHEGYSFLVSSKGVMGDRFVLIDPGPPQNDTISSDQPLKGRVMLGPSDAIAYMENFKSTIHTLEQLSTDLLIGTSSKASFVSQFKQIAQYVDSLSNFALIFSNQLFAYNSQANSLAQFIEKTLSVTRTISISVPSLISNLELLTNKASALVMKSDSLTLKIAKFTQKMDSPESIILRNNISDINKHLKSLQKTITEIRNGKLIIPVRPSL